MILKKCDLINLNINSIEGLKEYFIYYFQYSLQKTEFESEDGSSLKVLKFLDKKLESYADYTFYKELDLTKIWVVFCLELIKIDEDLKCKKHLMKSIDLLLDNIDAFEIDYLETYIEDISIILNEMGALVLVKRLLFNKDEIKNYEYILSKKNEILSILDKYKPLEDKLDYNKIYLPVGKDIEIKYQPIEDTFFEYWIDVITSIVSEAIPYKNCFYSGEKLEGEELKKFIDPIMDKYNSFMKEVIFNKLIIEDLYTIGFDVLSRI